TCRMRSVPPDVSGIGSSLGAHSSTNAPTAPNSPMVAPAPSSAPRLTLGSTPAPAVAPPLTSRPTLPGGVAAGSTAPGLIESRAPDAGFGGGTLGTAGVALTGVMLLSGVTDSGAGRGSPTCGAGASARVAGATDGAELSALARSPLGSSSP